MMGCLQGWATSDEQGKDGHQENDEFERDARFILIKEISYGKHSSTTSLGNS